MADLQPHVPQAIQDDLGDQLAPCGLLVGQEKQQIDVGAGCEHAAAVAAGRDDRHVLGFGWVLRGIEMRARELVHQPDDLVLHEAQPLGAAPSVPVADEQAFGDGAPLDQRSLEALADRRAQVRLIAGVRLGDLFEVGGDGRGVEQFEGPARRLVGDGQHGAPG